MASRSVLSIDIGVKNFALCAIDLPAVVVRTLESWDLGDTKALPTSAIVDRLLCCFHEWEFLHTWSPGLVLIEQQIRGAYVNLALAYSAYTYMKTRFPDATVKFVAPMAKFKAYETHIELNDAEIDKKKKDKTSFSTYTKRKRLAVDIAEAVLSHMGQPCLSTICPDVKKDDLADAFLQSFCC